MKFFERLVNIFNIFKHKNDNQEHYYEEERSRFEDFLFFVDENDPAFEDVSMAAELCEGALKVARHRALLDAKSKEYEVILDDVECYEKLSKEEGEYLKELINKFVSLTKERNTLRFQMGDFDPSLDKLMTLEEEAPDAIRQMEEAEIKERNVKQDLIYLKDEKTRLEAEKDNLDFGNKFLYHFNIAMVIIFGLAVMFLVMLHLFKRQVVFVPLTILCFILIFLVSLVYVFRRRIDFELKLNVKKQIKAVKLINKKTVVYSYYRNFLNYEYRKFNVNSSAGLRVNLKEYDNYKHITSRYDSIRNIMYETQRLLENFLREKRIKDISASIESFAKTIDIDDKIEYAKNIASRKQKIDEKITELDEKHERLWNELIRLNMADTTQDKVIERMIKSYLEEVSKISTSENDERLEFEIENEGLLNDEFQEYSFEEIRQEDKKNIKNNASKGADNSQAASLDDEELKELFEK